MSAEPECPEVVEVLQEFASYSTGATPEDAAAWPQWAPSGRRRYEILELPEPIRQERNRAAEREEDPLATE